MQLHGASIRFPSFMGAPGKCSAEDGELYGKACSSGVESGRDETGSPAGAEVFGNALAIAVPELGSEGLALGGT